MKERILRIYFFDVYISSPRRFDQANKKSVIDTLNSLTRKNTMEVFVSLQLDQFVVNDMVSAFTLDGLKNSHPIKVPVNHPDEINEIFDSISYNKVCF